MNSPWFKCYPSDFLNGVVDLSPAELAVYTVCIMRMYDEGGPIPDEPERISRRVNMRVSACRKALDALCQAGKLHRIDGCLSNARVEKENETRNEVSTKSARAAHVRWSKEAKKPNGNNAPPMQPHTGGICGSDAYQKPEARSQKNPPISPPDRFPEFWGLVPKKKEKLAAQRAWVNALKLATADELIAGMMRYAAECDANPEKWVKNPATWLNKGCWTDEPDEPASEPEDPFFTALRKNLAGDSDLRGRADMGEADSGDTGADDSVGSGYPRLTLISGTCGQADDFEVADTGQGFDGLEGKERHGMGDCPGGDVFAVGRNAR